MIAQICKDRIESENIDEWKIIWAGDLQHRQWCHQIHSSNNKNVLIIMFNPGKFNGITTNLAKDTTLRILREIFVNTNLNPFIINLFELSAPTINEFFNNWAHRDSKILIYNKLDLKKFDAIIYAYGNHEYHPVFGPEIRERISLVRNIFSSIPEIILPKNKSGTPKHPIAWQRQMIKPEIKFLINNFVNENT